MSRIAAVLAIVLMALGTAHAQLPTELPQTKFTSGQDVVPYFEGWIRNTDGTFDLVFGYFNRNWEETPAIAAARSSVIGLSGSSSSAMPSSMH